MKHNQCLKPIFRSISCGAAVLAALVLGGRALSQSEMPAPNPQGDPQKIVKDASWNELHSKSPGRSFSYRQHKSEPKGSLVKAIVETNQGDVARLLERNGKALTPEEEQAEKDRLDNLLAHPEIQEHRHKEEQKDSARGDEMVRMLPDAFLFEMDGTVDGPNGPCYRMKFKPNPSFVPPDREGEVYHGMVGELWVDQAQLRLVRIDAHLVSDVNFGWGIVGKLYKGGSIMVQNSDVGLNHWETIHMKLNLQGKILMVKSMDFSTTEDFTDFEIQPKELTYQEAVHLVKKIPPAQVNTN